MFVLCDLLTWPWVFSAWVPVRTGSKYWIWLRIGSVGTISDLICDAEQVIFPSLPQPLGELAAVVCLVQLCLLTPSFLLTAYRREQKGKKEASEQKKKDKDKKTDAEEQDKSRDEDNDEDEERLEEEEQNEEEEVDN